MLVYKVSGKQKFATIIWLSWLFLVEPRLFG